MTTPTTSAQSVRSITQLSHESPLTAVFLRTLAWECHVARRTLSVGQVVTNHLRIARTELGLRPLGDRKTSGGGDAFVQRLRKEGLISPKGTDPQPVDPLWEKEWRLINLPSHAQVRQLSYEPVVLKKDLATGTQPYTFFSIALRDPAMPLLDIWIGPNTSIKDAVKKRRGAYALRLASNLYLGKSDELDTRLRQHAVSRNPQWCMFCSPCDEASFTLDSLGAAESLLISFWNEICEVDNRNRGGDRPPAPTFLQQAILFTASVSAALIWIAREHPGLVPNSLPFKKLNTPQAAWPKCYLEPGR